MTLALGNWQLGRGREKGGLAERIQTADHDAPIDCRVLKSGVDDVAWRRVEVRGRFEPKYAVFIDNRVLHGVVGYHVVMPLKDRRQRALRARQSRLGGGNRDARDVCRKLQHPRTPVRIVGLATVPSKRYLELSTQVAEGNVWQNLTLERYRAAVPIAIQPVVIQQENDLGDGLKREWGAPDLGIEKHYGYAFQWFALAAAILIFYLVGHVRKRAQQPD